MTKLRTNITVCPKCEYVFCFACNDSACDAERHYESYRGCGALENDRLLLPQGYNEGGKARGQTKFKKIYKIPLLILFWPIVIFCVIPVFWSRKCLAKNKHAPLCLKIWMCFIVSIPGIILTPLAFVVFFLFFIQVFAFVILP